MRVFALVAERIPGRASFAFEARQGVQGLNNCESFVFMDGVFDDALTDGVFCIFDATG
jgi:hypothetical protein